MAESIKSALRQVSTAPPSPEPKQSLAISFSLLEPASWYQTKHIIAYIVNADMVLPTHRKLRPHS